MGVFYLKYCLKQVWFYDFFYIIKIRNVKFEI